VHGGAHRGGGGLVRDQRHLTKNIAWLEPRQGHSLGRVCARDHLDLARQHEKETLASLTLANQFGTGLDLVALEATKQLALLGLGEGHEERRRLQQVLDQALA